MVDYRCCQYIDTDTFFLYDLQVSPIVKTEVACTITMFVTGNFYQNFGEKDDLPCLKSNDPLSEPLVDYYSPWSYS